MVMGFLVDFWGYFFWRGGEAFLLGFSGKVGCRTWFFDGEFVVDRW
jgi:hypothetical protein